MSSVDAGARQERRDVRDHNVLFTPEVKEEAAQEDKPSVPPTEPSESLFTTFPTPSSLGVVGIAGVSVAKPLTMSQKLHKALNACKKKKPKRVRVACERKARNAFSAKSKPKPKIIPPPAIGLG